MDDPRPENRSRLLESLTALTSTMVAVAQNRLDLLSLDLEEEREHLLSTVTLGLGAFFCLGVSVILATMMLVLAFWDGYRVALLGSLAVTFLGLGLGAGWWARKIVLTKPRLFAGSLSEFGRDRRHLTPLS